MNSGYSNHGTAKYIALLLGFWLIFVFTSSSLCAETDNCIECHSGVNEEIVEAFQNDVHSRNGLSCADCHGGNPAIDDESSMDPKYGFIGAPMKKEQPGFCGKCHSDPVFMRNYNPSLPTDQVAKYWTSGHGIKLKKGDSKVATCANCHNAHNILPSNAPKSSVYPPNVPATCATCHSDLEYMAKYGIPTDQFAQYTDSTNVHGYALLVKKDIGAPACNDCHGNHGAAPPGFENVAQVCTQCHKLNGELFRDSPHKEAFDVLEVSECAFCHQASPSIDEPRRNIHTIVKPTNQLVGTSETAVCHQCHSEGEDGWAAAEKFSQLLDSLSTRETRARELLHSAEVKGFEVGEARWVLDSEVRQSNMELRTSIHAFSFDSFMPIYERADTSLNKVLSAGQAAIKELTGRRLYFIVITVLIAFLISMLVIKIKGIRHDDS